MGEDDYLYKGMKMLEKAAFSATYQSVWCAGPSIEYVKEIRPVRKIVETLIEEYYEALAVKENQNESEK